MFKKHVVLLVSLDDPLHKLVTDCVPYVLVVSAGGDEELVLDVNVMLRTPSNLKRRVLNVKF